LEEWDNCETGIAGRLGYLGELGDWDNLKSGIAKRLGYLGDCNS